jgi:hypothetical protein
VKSELDGVTVVTLTVAATQVSRPRPIKTLKLTRLIMLVLSLRINWIGSKASNKSNAAFQASYVKSVKPFAKGINRDIMKRISSTQTYKQQKLYN